MKLIELTFEVFQFDISGNEDKELQIANIEPMSITFEVSNFYISGNEDKELQFLKILLIL